MASDDIKGLGLPTLRTADKRIATLEKALNRARLALGYARDCMGECGNRHQHGRTRAADEIRSITAILNDVPPPPIVRFYACKYVRESEPNGDARWQVITRTETLRVGMPIIVEGHPVVIVQLVELETKTVEVR